MAKNIVRFIMDQKLSITPVEIMVVVNGVKRIDYTNTGKRYYQRNKRKKRMNRLTKRNGHYCDDCGYEPGEFCACNEEIAMYERLKQYEDAEEQGRLVEVRHGRWHDVYMSSASSFVGTCSVCGISYDIPPVPLAKYCPNCGAKMDGEENK